MTKASIDFSWREIIPGCFTRSGPKTSAEVNQSAQQAYQDLLDRRRAVEASAKASGEK